MGGSRQRQQTTSNTTNTYGYQTPPSTPDIDAVRGFQFSHDPRVPYSFGRAMERARDTYANPLGANTTQAIRDASLRATSEDLGQQEAQAYAEEGRALQGLDFARLMDVANLTQPRLVQTGGTTTSQGTAQSGGGLLNPLVQGGSAIGSALLL